MKAELEQLGELIAEQAAHFDAAMHRLLTDLREFDTRGGWHLQGARSCAHWLAWRVGWDLGTARQRVRVASKLAEFAAVDDALRRGEISYSKVRAIVRVATPATEALLLEYARLTTGSQLEKLSRKYRLVQRHGQESNPRIDEQRRYVRRRDTEDGMVKIEAVLHPEEAEMVWAMLNHCASQVMSEHAAKNARAGATGAVAHDVSQAMSAHAAEAHETPSINNAAHAGGTPAAPQAEAVHHARGQGGSAETSERAPSILERQVDATKRAFDRADALVSLAQRYLRGEQPNRTPIDVVMTVPAAALRMDGRVDDRTANGGASSTSQNDVTQFGEIGEVFVSHATARRLACDAAVVEIVEDEGGTPLSVGRKRRTISGSLRRALHRRDGACVYPGCDNRLFLEGHHIKHWADGGETSLLNAALICTLHHRFVHEYGYTVELGPDQRPRFRDPGGDLVPAVPARPTTAGSGLAIMRAANDPLAITAETPACDWDGSEADYSTIVGYLAAADDLN